MKTRDRILETSLMLFNDEGEHNVTTVDIANEMNISPGNLYYHFKGKESILEALFTRFDTEFSTLLRESGEARLDLKDYWFFIYVVFEELHKFRFLFVDLGDITNARGAGVNARSTGPANGRIVAAGRPAMSSGGATSMSSTTMGCPANCPACARQPRPPVVGTFGLGGHARSSPGNGSLR